MLLALFTASPLPLAQSAGNSVTHSPLPGILQKIESRRGLWNGFSGTVDMRFLRGEAPEAACRGDILYDRLNERMVIRCFNEESDLLFAFKTEDREFKLYLPGQNSVYEGNMFDAKYDPAIEMHVSPLDLYRALKPMMIPERSSEIERWGEDEIILKVYGQKYTAPYLARRVHASREGDVFKESYYSPAGDPVTAIYRSAFREFSGKDAWMENRFYYPEKIAIENESNGRATQLFFDDLRFFVDTGSENWELEIPKDVQVTVIPPVEKEDFFA